MKAAWRNATESETFRFATDLAQTTYPALALTNVGRSSRTETMRMEGSYDRPQKLILMNLWSGGGNVLNPQDALELRVQGDQAEGRVTGGDWQPVDNVADAFAPSGDFLGFLAGARNIRRQTATGVIPVAANGAALTAYAFDLDGPALAEHMRQQLEEQLAAKGELPPGVSLGTPEMFWGATGGGEIWLTAAGYPTQLSVQMSLPEQENGERSEVRFTTTFADFRAKEVLAAAPAWPGASFVMAIGAGLSDFARSPQNLLAIGFTAFMLFILQHRNRRRVYTGLTFILIFSMTVVPLIQAEQTFAFSETQRARQTEAEAARQAQADDQALQDQIYANTWDPQRDPLAGATSGPGSTVVEATTRRAGESALAAPLSAVTFAPLAVETTVAPTSDVDADGLTALQEARLGTDPNFADSDSDLISDYIEVKGFSYNNKTWYSDPTVPDSNNDGLLDSGECLERVDNKDGVCRDTDKDGTPDMFDADNDGDGVSDRMDLSPNRVMGSNGALTSPQESGS